MRHRIGEQAFLATPPDRRTVSPDRLLRPPSPYVLQAGSMIAAALVTGLRSDRPGQVVARVTENAFDSIHRTTSARAARLAAVRHL